MELTFGYGKGKIPITVPDQNLLAVLTPNQVAHELTGEAEVRRSLNMPIGSERLSRKVPPESKVVIVTSDITRPVPSSKIIPAILDELSQAGVEDKNITVVFALGSHRAHSEADKRYLVGDSVYHRVRCIDSDETDCLHMGVTRRGTPVDIFRPVAEADVRICVGNIEYHYFAGYSGGAKAIMPGVATRAAIQANHSRMVDPAACAGRLEGNPVREDIEDVVKLCPVDFIVNVVLNEKKEIIHSVSGDVVQAHRAGCAFLDTLYKTKIPRAADIVIVSPGGFPKDINMYQAQKALDNAKHAVRDGGCIIWLAACQEGLGGSTFEEWMTGHEKAGDMIEHIGRDFQLGGHKAAAIAMVLARARILLVSDLEADFVRRVHLEPFPDAQAALEEAFCALGKDASVIAMPYGGSTLPIVVSDHES